MPALTVSSPRPTWAFQHQRPSTHHPSTFPSKTSPPHPQSVACLAEVSLLAPHCHPPTTGAPTSKAPNYPPVPSSLLAFHPLFFTPLPAPLDHHRRSNTKDPAPVAHLPLSFSATQALVPAQVPVIHQSSSPRPSPRPSATPSSSPWSKAECSAKALVLAQCRVLCLSPSPTARHGRPSRLTLWTWEQQAEQEAATPALPVEPLVACCKKGRGEEASLGLLGPKAWI